MNFLSQMKINSVTAAEKVLLSAYDLYLDNKTFSAEDLIVKCWEKFPQDFSLKGYEKYPNSNSVLLHLMNKNGALLKNGWITKKQAKIYSISDTGVTHVESRLKKSNTSSNQTNKIEVPRQMLINLKGFLATRVVQEIINGEDHRRYKFVSACSFWKISPNMTYPEITTKLNNVSTWLETLIDFFNKSKKDFINIDQNSIIKRKSLDLLINANKHFLEKFKTDLDFIKKIRPNASRN